MSLIQDINPTEPLLWINDRPLLTLTYLWHLNQEDVSGNGHADLLWKLTKQLLIAVYQEKNYPILAKDMDTLLSELENDSTVSSLLNSQVITREILSDILKIQEIHIRYQQDIIKKLQQQLQDNDEEIQRYYEDDQSLFVSEVYEIYEYTGDKDIRSLQKQDLENLPIEDFQHFGSLSQQEIDRLHPGLQQEHIPKVIPYKDKPDKYLLVKAFHSSAHKAAYDMVKPRLVEIFATTLAEQEIEEEAQTYLEKATIRYNEKTIERILQISDLW